MAKCQPFQSVQVSEQVTWGYNIVADGWAWAYTLGWAQWGLSKENHHFHFMFRLPINLENQFGHDLGTPLSML